MCDSECQENYPNLVYVSARNSYCSMHFFTAASSILGPPSIFIAKSSKPNPYVTFDWKKLYDKNMYYGISIENTTSIYGVTYLSVCWSCFAYNFNKRLLIFGILMIILTSYLRAKAIRLFRNIT